MVKNSRKIWTLLLIAVLITFVGSCSNSTSTFPDIPDEIMELYTNYMSAAMEGVEAAKDHRYFVNDMERSAYLNNAKYRLKSYQLVHAEKLSEVLYVFTSDIESTEESISDIFYFAAWFDDQWHFVMNIKSIPEKVRENIDIGLYSYEVESVPFEAVVTMQ